MVNYNAALEQVQLLSLEASSWRGKLPFTSSECADSKTVFDLLDFVIPNLLEEQNTSTQKMHCAQNKVLREMQKVAEGSPGKMEFLSTNLRDLQRKLITEYPMKNTKEEANEKGGYDLGTAALDRSRTSKRAKFQHEHFSFRKKKSNISSARK
jgi:hypothetical protein